MLGVAAVYAFYNPAGAAQDLTMGCGWERMFPALGGVGLAGVEQVHTVAKDRTKRKESAAAMASITWPLSCALLCDDDAGLASESRPLDEVVAASLAASRITVSPEDQADQDPPGWFQDLQSLLVLRRGGDDVKKKHAAVSQGLGQAGICGVTVWRQNGGLDDAAPRHQG